jgi:hypothetical protein
MIAQISRGIPEVAVGDIIVSRERYDVVAFTDALGLMR